MNVDYRKQLEDIVEKFREKLLDACYYKEADFISNINAITQLLFIMKADIRRLERLYMAKENYG